MTLSLSQRSHIVDTIKNSLRNKLETYQIKAVVMPFHTRLLGQDRLALYSFIHSLNTNFGTTIFEPVAAKLAENNFKKVETQFEPGNKISAEAQLAIQEIMDELGAANRKPNKPEEIKSLKRVCNSGEFKDVKPTRVDIFLRSNQGEIYLIDLKTAKPNKGNFKEFKRTLLEWAAIYLANERYANINTLIAIPYNPDEPKPYSRWTMAGMLDVDNELKVAKEFWDFLGGEGAYEDLLDCFEKAGIEMRDEIDRYFKQFRAPINHT